MNTKENLTLPFFKKTKILGNSKCLRCQLNCSEMDKTLYWESNQVNACSLSINHYSERCECRVFRFLGKVMTLCVWLHR